MAATERMRGRRAMVQRERRMQRTNGLCERCMVKGMTTAAKVVDHIIPLSKGGPDEDGNTRNLCDPCHLDVTAQQFGHRLKQEIGVDGWPIA